MLATVLVAMFARKFKYSVGINFVVGTAFECLCL